MHRMANGRGSFVSRRHFLGWPLWDLYLVLAFSFQYSWIILMNRERKQVSYMLNMLSLARFVASESMSHESIS